MKNKRERKRGPISAREPCFVQEKLRRESKIENIEQGKKESPACRKNESRIGNTDEIVIAAIDEIEEPGNEPRISNGG